MMTSLEYYLQDGANWQAKTVFAIFQNQSIQVLDEVWNKNLHRSDASIYVGRYENCREQGYVFTLSYKAKQKHYAVYEHRNSDDICVLISSKPTINTPSVDDMWADKPVGTNKFGYDKGFPCGAFQECSDFVMNDMIETLKKWKEIKPENSMPV